MLRIFIFFLVLSVNVFALVPEEQQPEEQFRTYFARITRGQGFPGIYLKAPPNFAEKFRTYIRKSYWMGPAQKVRNELEKNNYNLWFDVFKTPVPQKFITMSNEFNSLIEKYCGEKLDYQKTEWRNWPTCLRRAWIDEALFHQSSALHLAKLYKLDLNSIISRTEIFLLNKADFEKKVREAGWDGPVYFRGATMPNPKNQNNRWIILNEDFLKQYTGFEYPVLQMLELVGIANHELSHVMQDFLGQQLGLDIQVRSAEQALLIEGQAEYMAQESFKRTNLFFKFFATEQAVEVVNREGDTSLLFPYSVGLPFVTTLYNSLGADNNTTHEILEILGQNKPLDAYLNLKFGL